MMKNPWCSRMVAVSVMLLFTALAISVQAETRTWVGGSDGNNWFAPANWSPSDAYPQAEDTVIIPSGKTVVLTNSTAELASFSITNSTMTFYNWSTALRATMVTIENNGNFNLSAAFTEAQMSNRVYVVCEDFTLNKGGQIDVNEKGWESDNGPGKGAIGYGGGGGGHGGKGGKGKLGAAAGVTCGSVHAPLDPGSGGGSYSGGYKKHGGGAVRIEATGTVTINGLVTANGQSGSTGGSGAGGSIYISSDVFGGDTNGLLRANGGDGGGDQDGCGGGGRIAVTYNSLSGTPGIRFSANRGTLSGSYSYDPVGVERWDADMGTVSFSDGQLLDSIFSTWGNRLHGLSGFVYVQSGSVWTSTLSSAMVVTNSTLGIPAGTSWNLTNDLVITASGKLIVEGGTLDSDADVTLTNGGILTTYGSATNSGTETYGALVDVAGSLTVETGCWIYPYSNPTNGGSALFKAGNLVVRDGGGFDANGRGFKREEGPGKGASQYGQGGGGYGGRGGHVGTEAYAGPIYGSTNAPIQPGSGGGNYQSGYYGGSGGGLVRVEVTGALTLQGAITAVGTNVSTAASAGSGGGIYIACQSLSSTASAVLNANGGDGRPSDARSGGGGGRIAVWVGVSDAKRTSYLAGNTASAVRDTTNASFVGTVSVDPGSGSYDPPDSRAATTGTVYFFTAAAAAALGATADNASDLGLTNATLNGIISGVGDAENPYTYFCWDISDKGTSGTSAWSHVVAMGNGYGEDESFEHTLNGLDMEETYGYRVFVTNSTGSAFSSSYKSFTTYGIPVVVALGTSGIGTNSATLLGEVTSTGGMTPTVGFEYWLTGGAVTSSVTVGPDENTFETGLNDLARDTEYTFRAWASNTIAGKVTSSTDSFRTLDRESRVFTWTGSSSTDWFNAGNWSVSGDPGYPDEFATVVIPGSKTVVLTNSTAELYSFSITNSTLTFSNWDTALRATSVTIENNAELTMPSAFSSAQMSNRVYIICSNLTLNAGGLIDADGLGWSANNGPGVGTGGRDSDGYAGGSGAYGGKGGRALGYDYADAAVPYGSATAPLDPGSAGGYSSGRAGGGAVYIDADGTVMIYGTITANGVGGASYGCGSGGSIYITANKFGGSTAGLLRANGGTAGYDYAVPGGGGRIAVHYNSLQGTPGVRFSVDRGRDGYAIYAQNDERKNDAYNSDRYSPDMGTVYFTDDSMLTAIQSAWSGAPTGLYGYVQFSSGSTWTTDLGTVFVITNSTLGVPANHRWVLQDDVVISTSGELIVDRYSTLAGSGSVSLTNGGILRVYAGATNDSTEAYGSLVDMSGTLAIGSGSYVYSHSNPTNGGSPMFKFGNLSILSGGEFNADALGYKREYGPGNGYSAYTYGQSGGGYGGVGGYCHNGYSGGAIYGSTNKPTDPGSGGGTYDLGYLGGYGGGLIRIEVTSLLNLEGTISACGTGLVRAAGAGSGGGIYLATKTLNASEASILRADGGNGVSGDSNSGGGGGRIAVWINVPEAQRLAYSDASPGRVTKTLYSSYEAFDGTVSVSGGSGSYNPPDAKAAQPGTAYFFTVTSVPGTIFRLR